MPGPNYGPNYDDLSAFLGMKGSANDAIKLRNLRTDRQGELDDNLANDPHNARLQHLSAMLNGDIADDPNTGVAAAGREQKLEDTFHAKDLYQDPRMAELRTQQEKEKQSNLLGEHTMTTQGDAQGKLNVDSSDLNQQMLDKASQRKQDELAVAPQIKASAPPATKFTQAEQSQLDRSATADEIGAQLKSLMEQDYPGIDKEPGKYGSATDMLGAGLGGALYSLGKTETPNQDRIKQLTGYMEAMLPQLVQQGRVNKTVYEDLKKHVPQLGLSAGANYERLNGILQAISPATIRGIQAGHQPGAENRFNAQPNYVNTDGWK